MDKLKPILAIHRKLHTEWNKDNPNLEECGQILAHLKVQLTKGGLAFLPTDAEANIQDIVVARDILEIGAQWAIAKKDVETFERYMAQLKCYYLDYRLGGVSESSYKHQLLGLNLLRLLAQNKLADFHTELELLTTEEMLKNVYIRHPVNLEQYLMEGSYNKVFLARDNIPAASYKLFMDILLNTMREEIARCIERAYERIQYNEAERLINFETKQAFKDFSTERKWVRSGDGFLYFHREQKADDVIPAQDLATQTIDYARELEMIV